LKEKEEKKETEKKREEIKANFSSKFDVSKIFW
jgi:hypothetical protein